MAIAPAPGSIAHRSAPSSEQMPPAMSSGVPIADVPARRQELAAFLRSRRERIAPDEAGLIAGPRRRTPGLRREEVAQLASVGVTWYTWLEQGRPIRASADVVDAIARALRLDAPEREHLFRLAEVTPVLADPGVPCLEPEIQVVLGHLQPLPACVLNSRYDVLAWNAAYASLFPGLIVAPPAERNVLWQVFAAGLECPFLDSEVESARLVATLRGAFSRHLGEPRWTEFVRDLSLASPVFAELWSHHDVAEPGNRLKRFRAPEGVLSFFATTFAVSGTPETRMVVYSPVDDATAAQLERNAQRSSPMSAAPRSVATSSDVPAAG
jgi:transcriptional regulator with XRE-family HTH domain